LSQSNKVNNAKDKTLFTPGPLTTSRTVKQAMLMDLGSRDTEFIRIVKEIRRSLLEVAEVEDKGYETIIMQGSGTFGVESVISSVTPPDGKWLIVNNGAYCRRIAQIASIHKIEYVSLDYAEDCRPDPNDIDNALKSDKSITHVSVVHCETTTGIINPVKEIGEIVKQHGKDILLML